MSTDASPSWRPRLRAILDSISEEEAPDLIAELARKQFLLQGKITRRDFRERPVGGSSADRCLTAAEVAELWGMSEKWVYIHREELGGVKLGSSVRFPEKALRKYLNSRTRR